MPVNLAAPERLLAVDGVRIATASLGKRPTPRHDLTLFELRGGARTAATFTRNAMCAAPVVVSRLHLGDASPRALIVNAGNANAGTGRRGIEAARRSCELVADLLGCAPGEVLPFSTGVIGEPLDVEAIARALPAMSTRLRADAWLDAAQAIMTTDVVAKGVSRTFQVGGAEATITGIAKGSGMIHPDMATMLSFIATDAPVDAACLQALLAASVERSFNRVTVDGDTSTNDACVLVATGALDVAEIAHANSDGHGALAEALDAVCQALAHAVVRDGEGATKFVSVKVTGGRDAAECARTAFTVAHSPLVKTALFASDANWGRILAAVGRSGVEDLDVDRVAIWLGEVQIVADGARAGDYTEERGAAVMARSEIAIRIELGRGSAEDEVWTCDLSHQYVTINAEYRS